MEFVVTLTREELEEAVFTAVRKAHPSFKPVGPMDVSLATINGTTVLRGAKIKLQYVMPPPKDFDK